jgi:hypothetical protein
MTFAVWFLATIFLFIAFDLATDAPHEVTLIVSAVLSAIITVSIL